MNIRMMTKTCFKCQEVKPLDDFYKHSRMADGHLNKCKECTKLDVNNQRAVNLDYYQQYDRQRFQSDPCRRAYQLEQMRAWAQQHQQNIREIKRAWINRNPHKRYAQLALSKAVRNSKIIKPYACQICETTGNLQGHHHDYTKPLDVLWVCVTCHSTIHRLEREHQRQSSQEHRENHAQRASHI